MARTDEARGAPLRTRCCVVSSSVAHTARTREGGRGSAHSLPAVHPPAPPPPPVRATQTSQAGQARCSPIHRARCHPIHRARALPPNTPRARRPCGGPLPLDAHMHTTAGHTSTDRHRHGPCGNQPSSVSEALRAPAGAYFLCLGSVTASGESRGGAPSSVSSTRPASSIAVWRGQMGSMCFLLIAQILSHSCRHVQGRARSIGIQPPGTGHGARRVWALWLQGSFSFKRQVRPNATQVPLFLPS